MEQQNHQGVSGSCMSALKLSGVRLLLRMSLLLQSKLNIQLSVHNVGRKRPVCGCTGLF